jgi:oligopeptide transport system permease protein
VTAAAFLALMCTLAAFAPWLPFLGDPAAQDLAKGATPPSLAHWFGTDELGRDLFARVLHGGRISMLVGLVGTLVSLIVGVTWGAVAGYVGGRTDDLMMRVVDVLFSVPLLFVVILIVAVLRERAAELAALGVTRLVVLYLVIGAVSWLTMARIVRGQTLSAKQKEFVEAARAAGVGPFGIIRRHIVPNVVGPVIVYVTLTIPGVILAESFLSFLGLGIREPFTSWGVLISEGAGQMETAPWALVFPAVFMALTLFCFNFIGDGLRDALDPKDR